MTERLHFHFSLSCIREGNGNAFQCSCLENLRDGGAWWAAVYGVAQSRRRLKLIFAFVFCALTSGPKMPLLRPISVRFFPTFYFMVSVLLLKSFVDFE